MRRINVENNYVSFAGQTWRIVRINENGTVRLVMNDTILSSLKFTSTMNDYRNMYYTNSEVKPILEKWYTDNLQDYDDKIEIGTYCEQAKVKTSNDFTSGNVSMNIYTSYTPSFRCETDLNGYGIVNSKIGLISYDEGLYAGGYYSKGSNYYLNTKTANWTMSPAGINGTTIRGWGISSIGELWDYDVDSSGSYRLYLKPVINLKVNTQVIGTGTSTDPYVLK